jgi:hypothetical protein
MQGDGQVCCSGARGHQAGTHCRARNGIDQGACNQYRPDAGQQKQADSAGQQSAQRAPQGTLGTPNLQALVFIGIGDAEKVIALAARLVQDGNLIHREIMFDHLLDLRLRVVGIVKHGTHQMIGMRVHACLSLPGLKTVCR